MSRRTRTRDTESLVRLFRRGPKWWADFTEDGKRVRRSLGTPHVGDARMLAAKIEERLRRKVVGIEDMTTVHVSRAIAEHVADFKVTMEARGVTSTHVRRTVAYLNAYLDFIKARTLADLDLASASRWLEEGRAGERSARTLNLWAQSLRAFGRWAVETRRIGHDAFLGLSRRNVEADRRRVRRALFPEELARLLEAARARPLAEAERRAADEAKARRASGRPSGRGVGAVVKPSERVRLRSIGEQRATVYAVAAATGLRRGELSRVRWSDLELVERMVEVPAASAKARTDQAVPLRADIASLLAAVRNRRPREGSSALVFPSGWIPTARTFAKDLVAAGLAKRDDAGSVDARDEDGRIVDFHALRGTFISSLAAAGVHPRTAQALARHSSIELTMKAYTDPRLLDLRAAVERTAPVGVPETCQKGTVSG